MYEILVIAFTAVFGLCAGSFLNVCIWRLPREGLSISKPRRSICPCCEKKISWRDNIPVISWLLLRARCRSCGQPISIRYPLVEVLTAAVCVLVVWRFHLQLYGDPVSCIVLVVLVCALIVAAFIDADLRILPDEITITGMHLLPLAMLVLPGLRFSASDELSERVLAGLCLTLPDWSLSAGPAIALMVLLVVLSFACGCLCYRRYRLWRLPAESSGFFDVSLAGLLLALSVGLIGAVCIFPDIELNTSAYNLVSTLLGMLAGSGLVFFIGKVGSYVFRKPAMGFGDVKLMGLLGGLAGGCWGALTAFFLACILGSIVGIPKRLISGDSYLGFGPFLIVAGVFVYLWPDAVDLALDWYLGLFSA